MPLKCLRPNTVKCPQADRYRAWKCTDRKPKLEMVNRTIPFENGLTNLEPLYTFDASRKSFNTDHRFLNGKGEDDPLCRTGLLWNSRGRRKDPVTQFIKREFEFGHTSILCSVFYQNHSIQCFKCLQNVWSCLLSPCQWTLLEFLLSKYFRPSLLSTCFYNPFQLLQQIGCQEAGKPCWNSSGRDFDLKSSLPCCSRAVNSSFSSSALMDGF